MALTLRVTSFQSQALGSRATKTFGPEGGSIGRSPDSDWVLEDPERVVSNRHADVVRRGDGYCLLDLSTNGTFVNGSTQPIGKGAEQPLADGDQIQIGDYTIAASLDATGRGAVAGSMPFDVDSGSDSAIGPAAFTGEDVGQASSVDPMDFFDDLSAPSAPLPNPGAQADNASTLEQFYQPPPVEPSAPPSSASEVSSGGIPENWDETGFTPSQNTPSTFNDLDLSPSALPPAATPLPSATPETSDWPPPPAASPPPPADAGGAFAATLQAAGMDPASAREAALSPALATEMGKLIAVVVQGMLDVLKARAETKDQFRVQHTQIKPTSNNPLKFSANPQQALQNLFMARDGAYLGPVEAFGEGFEDVRAHQVAMIAGMRAAFDSVIERFDPERLEETFQKRLKRAPLKGLGGKGRYWDMYKDLYEDWTQDADLNFQSLFGEAFAKAYEQQMRRLTSKLR